MCLLFVQPNHLSRSLFLSIVMPIVLFVRPQEFQTEFFYYFGCYLCRLSNTHILELLWLGLMWIVCHRHHSMTYNGKVNCFVKARLLNGFTYPHTSHYAMYACCAIDCAQQTVQNILRAKRTQYIYLRETIIANTFYESEMGLL